MARRGKRKLVSNYVHFSMPGGWVTYALIGALIIFMLSYFDVKWSVFAMAPFLILEVGVLVILDIAIGIADGKVFNQVDGIYPYTWLVIKCKMERS